MTQLSKTQPSQTQPMCTESASSWALPNARRKPHLAAKWVATPSEMKMGAQGFSVAPWLGKHHDSALVNAAS